MKDEHAEAVRESVPICRYCKRSLREELREGLCSSCWKIINEPIGPYRWQLYD